MTMQKFPVVAVEANLIVLASSAQTVTFTTPTFLVPPEQWSAVVIMGNVTAVSGTTPTLTVQMQMIDWLTGVAANIPGAVTASITATGKFVLAVGLGIGPVTNQAVSFPLPSAWNLLCTIAGTTPSFTLSISGLYSRKP